MTLRLIACLVLCWGSAPAGAEDPIPLEHFFNAPDLTRIKVSPDGSHLVGISPADDHQTLVVVDVESEKVLRRLVVPEPRLSPLWLGDGERRIADFWWADDDRLLVSVAMRGGHTSYLAITDKTGSRVRQLYHRPDKAGLYQDVDRVLNFLPDDPQHVLMEFPKTRSRELAGYEVHAINLYSGETKRVERLHRHVVAWFADATGAVRAGYGLRGSKPFVLHRTVTGSLKELDALANASLGRLDLKVLGVGTGNDLYVASRHAGDRFAIYRYDVQRSRFDPLFSHPEVDVSGPLVSNRRGVPIGVRYIDDYERIHWFDKDWQQRQREVDAALPGLVNTIESWSRDRSRLVVRSQSDRQAPIHSLFREPGGRRLLARELPELDRSRLVASPPIRYAARDGMEIPGYLTLPRASEGKPAPFIIMPYGGSWSRATRGFDADVQFLASRGYGVLRINTRGTPGLGKRHQVAGEGAWGLSSQDDIVDGVRWLVEQGHADPARLCIYGQGYGGYAAVMGLVVTPDLFRCGVTHAGISNLSSFLSDRGVYVDAADWHRRIGGDRGQLQKASAIRHVQRIDAPVFVSYGEQDRVVDPTQSKSLVSALSRAGKKHYVMEMPNDGHRILRQESRLSYYLRLEAFLRSFLAPVSSGSSASDETSP